MSKVNIPHTVKVWGFAAGYIIKTAREATIWRTGKGISYDGMRHRSVKGSDRGQYKKERNPRRVLFFVRKIAKGIRPVVPRQNSKTDFLSVNSKNTSFPTKSEIYSHFSR